ncbi:hypothetical protein [Streptomyces sp. RFCAC02]|uniref:hypothetical protein n=1 Tax=Streptomyces sp. RFCAC02 TaxID=2499143 RepID=UPI00101F30B8|nr:hypothetical protein [Streptomyces sp. RFCAC02]
MKVLRLAAMLTAPAFLCAACVSDGTQQREYALPDTLCGLIDDQDLYAPFFPPGEEVWVDDSSVAIGAEGTTWIEGSCSLSVDHEYILVIQVAPVRQVEQELGGFLTEDLDPEAAEEVTDSPIVSKVWPHAAIAHTDCAPPSRDGDYEVYGIDVLINAEFQADEDFSEELARLINPVAQAWFDLLPDRYSSCVP